MEESNQVKEFLLFGQPYWIGVLVSAIFLAGATCGGVLLSFYLENRRRHREGRDAFGRLIESVFVESAVNQAILGNIVNLSTAGKIVSDDIEMSALQTTLTTDLTYKYAPWSLVKTMTIVSTKLSAFRNILAMQRYGGSYGKAPTEMNVEELKTHAGKCRDLIIKVLQPEIELLRPQFRAMTRRDERSKEVGEKMKKILNNGSV